MSLNRKHVWAALLTLAVVGCEEIEPADPGGMGAGRPDETSGEVPAAEVLRHANTPEASESTRAGAPTPT